MQRFTKLFIAICLATGLASLPVKAAHNIDTGGSVPVVKVPKPLTSIKQAKFAKISPVAPVSVPQAPPGAPVTSNASPAGCVTGWFTGDPIKDYIINHESGGNSCATNPGGCFGLMQACPGEPLRIACGGNPACQIEWFTNNKLGSYGTWDAVYQHELAYGWW